MGSGGVDFCVSSTSFQKSNVGWPQQPPQEKVIKFNMIIHDSSKVPNLSKNGPINKYQFASNMKLPQLGGK